MSGGRAGRVLLCGPDTEKIVGLVEATLGAQADTADADWTLPITGSATLSKGDDGYRLTTTRARIGLGGALSWRWTSEHIVEIGTGFTTASNATYGAAGIVLDGARLDDAAAEFLREATLALAAGRPRRLHRLVVVIANSLVLLERRLPIIDAVDAWDLVRSGESLGKSPMLRAQNAESWSDLAEGIDRGWGRHLRQLARAAQGRGIKTGLLAVSTSGFYPRTGMVAEPDGTGTGRIVFNLQLLVQALSPHVRVTLPQPFAS